MNQIQPSNNIRRFLPIIGVILFVSVGVVGYTACQRMNDALHKAEQDRARIETNLLAAVLGDPFSMGEYDHMQQIVDTAKRADGELVYAIIMSSDGRVIATTDRNLLNQRLTRNAFEKSALQMTDYTVHNTPFDASTFETGMPIKTAGGQAGILRLGFTTTHLNDVVASSLASVIITALAAALLGIWAIDMAGKRSCAQPPAAQ